jgi:GTP-binding protein
MFADIAEVSIAAGDGGRGAVSFRHEKYVDKGGPDGGDGGRGGNVIFVADPNTNTLVDFRYQPKLVAKNGDAGQERKKHGRNGVDLVVKVPVGTIVYRDGELVADLTEIGENVVIANGGGGGFGNAHFKSSTRQTPRIAEVGEKGDKFAAKLELKILADVGLVGFPNAGKSTFLSVVTSARPEIADYAFTTLTPNLGVAYIDESELLIADIPGLIEGAAEGKGLGDEFLRHVERTSVILHLIDVLTDDVADAYTKIRAELKKYSAELAGKPEIVALTKIDAVDDEIVAMQSTALSNVTDSPIFALSSSAHKNLTEILRALASVVTEEKARKAAEAAENDLIGEMGADGVPTISLGQKQLDDAWTVEKITSRHPELDSRSTEIPDRVRNEGAFVVRGAKIEKFAARTDFENIHSLNRLRDIMKKMGIIHGLEREGAKGDSMILIQGSQAFSFREQSSDLTTPQK